MTPDEISEADPRPVLLKEVLRKYSINLIYVSKFLSILYHKPIKEVIFSKALPLYLATLLRK